MINIIHHLVIISVSGSRRVLSTLVDLEVLIAGKRALELHIKASSNAILYVILLVRLSC